MDCQKAGALIRQLRLEKRMTQRDLADKMNLSDKTISKWERGMGFPDVSLLSELSLILEVNIEEILNGEISVNDFVGGNMKNVKYYVCPVCSNLTVCTGDATVSCCGRRLESIEMKKANDDEKINVEEIENDWYITCEHEMTKEHYISFIAFATGDKLQIIKQYPEWNLQARIPKREHGKLIWYCTKHGMFYQYL